MADHNRVLPATPFSPPMRPIDEVPNESIAAALKERGVAWPIGGYAPGHYLQTCRACEQRHTAAKGADVCLPCALVVAIGIAVDHRDRFEDGVAEGRKRTTEDVKRALGIDVVPPLTSVAPWDWIREAQAQGHDLDTLEATEAKLGDLVGPGGTVTRQLTPGPYSEGPTWFLQSGDGRLFAIRTGEAIALPIGELRKLLQGAQSERVGLGGRSA